MSYNIAVIQLYMPASLFGGILVNIGCIIIGLFKNDGKFLMIWNDYMHEVCGPNDSIRFRSTNEIEIEDKTQTKEFVMNIICSLQNGREIM